MSGPEKARWWNGRKWKALDTGPARSSREWAERALEKLHAKQDPESVLALYEKSLERQIRVHGVDSGPAANARGDVAKQLESMDRLDEARVFRQETFDAYTRNRGVEDPYTLGAEEWLAVNLARCGLTADAIIHIEHVIEVRTQTYGPDHQDTVEARELRRKIREGPS
jgi:hypothetical protein